MTTHGPVGCLGEQVPSYAEMVSSAVMTALQLRHEVDLATASGSGEGTPARTSCRYAESRARRRCGPDPGPCGWGGCGLNGAKRACSPSRWSANQQSSIMACSTPSAKRNTLALHIWFVGRSGVETATSHSCQMCALPGCLPQFGDPRVCQVCPKYSPKKTSGGEVDKRLLCVALR